MDPNNYLKKAIWLYFLLIIFEGALRKWFLPFLATPLLIVRDPLAIWLIYYSWKKNLFPSNVYITGMMFIGIIGIITALLFGHGNIAVAIYGARILLFHFPIMFIIGSIFKRDDVLQIGRVLLWMSIPMVILIGLQFYSPQSAWVNRGVGGNMEGAGFNGGAMGYFRPPGTFSFTIGNVYFFSLVACYVFYFWISNSKINRRLLIAASLALLASVSFSISRTLFYSICLSFIFSLMASITRPKLLIRMLLAMFIGAIFIFILSQMSIVETGTEAFASRFDNASKVEGGVSTSIIDRFFGGMLDAIEDSNNLPFFGYGIGMGTNVGAMLIAGKTIYLISEMEWGRLVGELGFLFGIMVILIRVVFSVQISIQSFNKVRTGDILPWLLLSFGFVVIVQGQWAQPTILGFSTFVGGLILASLKKYTTE